MSRNDVIIFLLKAGFTRKEITQYRRDQEWGKSYKSIANLWRKKNVWDIVREAREWLDRVKLAKQENLIHQHTDSQNKQRTRVHSMLAGFACPDHPEFVHNRIHIFQHTLDRKYDGGHQWGSLSDKQYCDIYDLWYNNPGGLDDSLKEVRPSPTVSPHQDKVKKDGLNTDKNKSRVNSVQLELPTVVAEFVLKEMINFLGNEVHSPQFTDDFDLNLMKVCAHQAMSVLSDALHRLK